MISLQEMGKNAKKASRTLSVLSSGERDRALKAIADGLLADMPAILKANAEDMDAARSAGMRESMLDRLSLTEERIRAISSSVLEVIHLPDPVGRFTFMSTRPNGLQIGAKRVPIGVIGIIYEARPNVTVDAAILCIKSGNATILRGGKEALRSNRALVATMQNALKKAGFDPDMVQLIDDPSREIATEFMRLREYLDLLIPRGGAGLIRSVVENASVPVIETGTGNCHVYVDAEADLPMAAEILFNAKCSRPSVCNAAETVLIHKDVAASFIPLMCKKLAEKNVELRCDPASLDLVGKDGIPATDEDFATEFGDYILAVRVVSSLDEAIEHIMKYTTGHSEAIVTENYSNAQRFLNEVDAACVYVNASTRFTDGNEFGLGAEIGISTQKMHARGPMGLEALTTVKYVIYGNGQVR